MENWFQQKCRELEDDYGRGWKRRLAKLVGVSDSNVQSWVKAGTVPPAVRTAIEMAERVEELQRVLAERNLGNFIIESMSDGRYRLQELDSKSGRFIECAILKDIKDAHALVSIRSGELDKRINQLIDATSVRCDDAEYRALANKLTMWRTKTHPENNAEFDSIISLANPEGGHDGE